MKAVLISIQPKWCELIASGKKTVEVRKTRPKIDTPFKVYIYCTANKQGVNDLLEIHGTDGKIRKANGKVIGEFVCDKVDRIAHCGTCNSDIRLKLVDKNLYCKELDYEYLNKCKLSYFDIDEYSNGGDVYGWHISSLVIYDTPKELSEFKHWKKFDWWDYGHHTNKPQWEWRSIERPPQSWCYVERLGEG